MHGLFGKARANVFGDDPTGETLVAPAHWRAWIRALFPRHFDRPLGRRHEELWEWTWHLRRGVVPEVDLLAIWPRESGKSTTAEGAVCAVGTTGRRGYAIYVRETQDMADKSVANIGLMLEGDEVRRYYPRHARPAVGKHGNQRGWRRNRLWTAGGFIVDALGLDVAVRGIKVDDQRPDFAVLDDIDGKHDSPATTAKKKAIITSSVLPALSQDGAALGVQNLIIEDGIFTQLVDGRADFLARRIVSGPFPAVEGLVIGYEDKGPDQPKLPRITGGTATWEGQPLERCEKLLQRIGPSAFLTECQHEVKGNKEGRALRYEPARHDRPVTLAQKRALAAGGQPIGMCDFGAWRFCWLLALPDEAGRLWVTEEVFSQKERMGVRARKIEAVLERLGLVDVPFITWGDAANPTDIEELNAALETTSVRMRVAPVGMDGKLRKAGVERVNELLDTDALLLANDLGEGQEWRAGWNAASQGVALVGSRLRWELPKWKYPIPKEGEAQKQDPDDHTADGADALAALRYGVMTYWAAKQKPVPDPRHRESEDQHPGWDRGNPEGLARRDTRIPEPVPERPAHARDEATMARPWWRGQTPAPTGRMMRPGDWRGMQEDEE